MRDVLPTLESWIAEGRRFATATVTQTWGSSPRPIGAVMGIRDDGVVIGSVSGGCVENAVIEEALIALQSGKPKELVFEAIGEDAIWDVGLSCGGKIQVWVEPDPVHRTSDIWSEMTTRVHQDLPIVMITDLDSGDVSLWQPGNHELISGLQAAYDSRRSQQLDADGRRLFLAVYPARERALIVGSVHIAVPLVKYLKELGFETIVVDPRSGFATPERFPIAPDRILAEWPDTAIPKISITESTYVVVLTHDPKIDDVALAMLLREPVAYIGALGSRVTQAKRRETLLSQGFTDAEVDRIHGPIGLNIGAKTPEEIALSIAAEIVQVRRRTGKVA